MNENITRLEYEGKEIILIATAHVSKESAELVKQVIEEERPDSVCVELDEDRYSNLQNPKAWENTDIVKVIKSKKVGFLLANLILSAFQKRMAKQLGVSVGSEMIQGIESAKETGAQLVLADRKIQTTFQRIWRKLGLWEKSKLLCSLIFTFDDEEEVSEEDLQELLQADMLESIIKDTRKRFPKIGEVLISERDRHLAAKIKDAPGQKVVAILGGAHVPGVKEEIYLEQDIEAISTVPPKGPFSKIASWIIPIALIALIVYAFSLGVATGLEQLSVWILWKSGLAALFTLLAFGHPLSILTVFAVAPFTTINPFIACGWFAGLVEASLRKPTVQDVLNVQDDIFSLKGFYRNRFLKTLMIVIFANIGASLGTFIAMAGILRNLL